MSREPGGKCESTERNVKDDQCVEETQIRASGDRGDGRLGGGGRRGVQQFVILGREQQQQFRRIKGQTITYWASVEGTGPQQTTQTLSSEFATFTKQTGVHVNLQVIPWSDLLQKILTSVTSGNGPDVMEIGNTWSPSFAASGGFLSFGSSQFSQIGGKDKFSTSALSVAGAPGKAPISIPVYSEAYGLFYNKADFAAAGLSSPPSNWNDFLTDAKKLTTGGRYGVAIEGASTSEAAHWAFLLGEQNGNPLYKNGKWDFATPTEAKAVSLYINLVADGVANKSDAESNSNVSETQFASNKAAMLVWQNPMLVLRSSA